jgi:hypothetical protein
MTSSKNNHKKPSSQKTESDKELDIDSIIKRKEVENKVLSKMIKILNKKNTSS